jgi:hypothetical protein
VREDIALLQRANSELTNRLLDLERQIKRQERERNEENGK